MTPECRRQISGLLRRRINLQRNAINNVSHRCRSFYYNQYHVVWLIYFASMSITLHHHRRRRPADHCFNWKGPQSRRTDFDSEMNMRALIAKTGQTCFYHLRHLRQIRRLLGRDVLSRIDCCNAVLSGILQSTIAPLQRVLNAAARVVCGRRPRDHWSDGYQSQHVGYRVQALSLDIPSAKRSRTILHHWHTVTCLNSRPPSHLAFGRQPGFF